MLEVFADARVVGPRNSFSGFVEEVTKRLAPPWKRNVDAEARIALSAKSSPRTYVFLRDVIEKSATLDLFLMDVDSQLKVTNIVPKGTQSLSKAYYNEILQEFFHAYMQPAASEMGLEAKLSKTAKDISEWLSDESASALRSFSLCTNKGTGSGHPSDFNRWAKFIILAHNEDAPLHAEMLQRWLLEEENFPEDVAIDLASEYSFGRQILKFYDDNRD